MTTKQGHDISRLQSLYTKIESEIDEELQRELPDQSLLARLKREKIRIKDEIARLGTTSSPHVEYHEYERGPKDPYAGQAYRHHSHVFSGYGSVEKSEFSGKIYVGEGNLGDAIKISACVFKFLETLGYKITAEGGFEQGSWKEIFGFSVTIGDG